MYCPLCHTARESDQSFRSELHVLPGLNKRSGTRPLADFTAMSKRRRMTIHIERSTSTNACRGIAAAIPIQGRLRASRATLQRARLCRGRSTPSGRTGGPPACPSAMRSQARPRAAQAAFRRAQLRPAAAARRLLPPPASLGCRPPSAAAASLLRRPPYSMSSVKIVMYSPRAIAPRSSPGAGS